MFGKYRAETVWRSLPCVFCHKQLFFAVKIFQDRGVDIIFVFTHLHLHRCGVSRKLQMTEMIKEEQDSDGEPNGIRNLQYGKTAGDFSCYLKIDLLEKCATSTSVLKVMMENAAPKNVARQTRITLSQRKSVPGVDSFL